MAAAEENDNMVSKSTMFMVAAAALIIGFLGGIVFSVFKGVSSPTAPPAQQVNAPAASGQAPVAGDISPEDSNVILALEKEVAIHPDDTISWRKLADKYFDTNQVEKAINGYHRVLDKEPNIPDVWTDLGVMYRRNHQPQEALAAFDKAAKLAPNHQACRFNRGVVYLYDLNDPEKAIASWQEVLAINPKAIAPNGKPLAELIAAVKEQAAKSAKKTEKQ